MKKYQIISRTDGYHARRYGRKCEVVEKSGMTLQEAQKELLRMFNYDFEKSCPNWGAAVMATRARIDGAIPTASDGTRVYNYDIWSYEITEEEE